MRTAILLLGLVVLGAGATMAFFQPTWACAIALIAWWLACSLTLGAQANLWIHDLTGGAWGVALRPYLVQVRSWWPLISVLLLPLALIMPTLYPWAQEGWTPSSARPQFQSIWFHQGFVFTRLLLYALLLNGVLFILPRWLTHTSRGHTKALLAALGLIVWGYTASLLGVDLLMSLTPSWYSSGFGLVLLAAQIKFGLAWATIKAAPHASGAIRRDLGNLLLAYILMWAYLAWAQFQIIWAENLPNEISWYVLRLQSAWAYLAIALLVFGLFVPLVLLLFRTVKENALALRAVATLICLMALAETLWLVWPSVGTGPATQQLATAYD